MKNRNEQHTPSEARIRANRENAKKSTGPRTPEGKAASSRNHLLHGLRANKHILPGEDPEDFLALLHDLFDRFLPVGEGEEKLVLRIAADQWRLDRTLPMEAAVYRQCLEVVAARDYTRKRELVNHKRNHERNPEIPPAPAPPDPGDRLTRAFIVDGDGRNSLTRLARYETSIERSIDRCLRQLQAYQAARIAAAPEASQAAPPAETAPPEAEQATPSEPTPAATPSKKRDYHSNPNNEGIAQPAAPSAPPQPPPPQTPTPGPRPPRAAPPAP